MRISLKEVGDDEGHSRIDSGAFYRTHGPSPTRANLSINGYGHHDAERCDLRSGRLRVKPLFKKDF